MSNKIAVYLQTEMFSISGKNYKRQRYVCVDTKSFEDAEAGSFALLDKGIVKSDSAISTRTFLHYV